MRKNVRLQISKAEKKWKFSNNTFKNVMKQKKQIVILLYYYGQSKLNGEIVNIVNIYLPDILLIIYERLSKWSFNRKLY